MIKLHDVGHNVLEVLISNYSIFKKMENRQYRSHSGE